MIPSLRYQYSSGVRNWECRPGDVGQFLDIVSKQTGQTKDN